MTHITRLESPVDVIEQDAKTSVAGEPPIGICLAFGVGTVGTAVLLNTVTVYLPAFMATVLGRSVATAGLLLTLSKLYDVVCDVVIGLASDRTRSRFGRRRPYMLAGALIGSLACRWRRERAVAAGTDSARRLGPVRLVEEQPTAKTNTSHGQRRRQPRERRRNRPRWR